MSSNVACAAILIAVVLGGGFSGATIATAGRLEHGFVTLDRGDSSSDAGTEVSYVWASAQTKSLRLKSLRFLLYGEYLDPRNGLGAYIQLPVSYYSSSGKSGFGLCDFDLQAILLRRAWRMKLLFHAGLALPTGSVSGSGEAANAFSSPHRLTDYYLSLPAGTSVRFGLSPLFRHGRFFGRVDAAADVNIANGAGSEHGGAFHINVGGGVALGRVALTAEVANLDILGASQLWLDTGALGVGVTLGTFRPYAVVVVPLDSDAASLFRAAATIGLSNRW